MRYDPNTGLIYSQYGETLLDADGDPIETGPARWSQAPEEVSPEEAAEMLLDDQTTGWTPYEPPDGEYDWDEHADAYEAGETHDHPWIPNAIEAGLRAAGAAGREMSQDFQEGARSGFADLYEDVADRTERTVLISSGMLGLGLFLGLGVGAWFLFGRR